MPNVGVQYRPSLILQRCAYSSPFSPCRPQSEPGEHLLHFSGGTYSTRFSDEIAARDSLQQFLVHRLVASREAAEDHLKIGMVGQHRFHLANSDFGSIADGTAVHPSRDAGESYRAATVLDGDRQRVAVAPRQLLRLTMLAVAIDGSDRVDHELGWQLEPWRNPRLARRASHPRTHLRHFETRLVEFSTSSPMDRPVHPAARPLARPSGSPSAKFPSETSFYGAFPNITWFAALTMASTASFAISPCSIRIIFLPCQPICRQFDDLLQRHSA